MYKRGIIFIVSLVLSYFVIISCIVETPLLLVFILSIWIATLKALELSISRMINRESRLPIKNIYHNIIENPSIFDKLQIPGIIIIPFTLYIIIALWLSNNITHEQFIYLCLGYIFVENSILLYILKSNLYLLFVFPVLIMIVVAFILSNPTLLFILINIIMLETLTLIKIYKEGE